MDLIETVQRLVESFQRSRLPKHYFDWLFVDPNCLEKDDLFLGYSIRSRQKLAWYSSF
jgi:hypothetical protein